MEALAGALGLARLQPLWRAEQVSGDVVQLGEQWGRAQDVADVVDASRCWREDRRDWKEIQNQTSENGFVGAMEKNRTYNNQNHVLRKKLCTHGQMNENFLEFT